MDALQFVSISFIRMYCFHQNKKYKLRFLFDSGLMFVDVLVHSCLLPLIDDTFSYLLQWEKHPFLAWIPKTHHHTLKMPPKIDVVLGLPFLKFLFAHQQIVIVHFPVKLNQITQLFSYVASKQHPMYLTLGKSKQKLSVLWDTGSYGAFDLSIANEAAHLLAKELVLLETNHPLLSVDRSLSVTMGQTACLTFWTNKKKYVLTNIRLRIWKDPLECNGIFYDCVGNRDLMQRLYTNYGLIFTALPS